MTVINVVYHLSGVRFHSKAHQSSHSRGSTIDLTIIDSEGYEIEMGSKFDFFSTISWPSDKTVGTQARGKVEKYINFSLVQFKIIQDHSNMRFSMFILQ